MTGLASTTTTRHWELLNFVKKYDASQEMMVRIICTVVKFTTRRVIYKHEETYQDVQSFERGASSTFVHEINLSSSPSWSPTL